MDIAEQQNLCDVEIGAWNQELVANWIDKQDVGQFIYSLRFNMPVFRILCKVSSLILIR